MTEIRRAQPPQNPPPVQRLFLQYCKRGRARFTSHRDVARALERALRRADIPMAFSSGFNPHPRISWAGASATGAATEADYLELGLRERCEPGWVQQALSAAMPSGIDIVDVWEWDKEADPRPLVDRLTASAWIVEMVGPELEVTRRAVAALLGASEVHVERQTKAGVRRFDARASILALGVTADGRLNVTLRHDSPLVRPDDVTAALAVVEPALILDAPPLVTRVSQGHWVDGAIVGPNVS